MKDLFIVFNSKEPYGAPFFVNCYTDGIMTRVQCCSCGVSGENFNPIIDKNNDVRGFKCLSCGTENYYKNAKDAEVLFKRPKL